ncbi:CRISPR-associated protein Cas2 [Priestia megaterium]|uniref:CRISPR-associated protein Cas2 n=1 Tax=Priestia megaterium TaxID=1404 RepID=UPI00215B3D28|nr:CRISPR-associated protein Cas2 [Priestia megaterium]MCR8865064.1 CRISPR-associated protein Cas2 [Priestia megaterium]
MGVYVVSYDLMNNETPKDYRRVIGAIKELGDAKEFQRSVWLLKTTKSTTEIRDYLKTYIDSDDSLFVGNVVSYASSNLPKDISDTMFSDWSKPVS